MAHARSRHTPNARQGATGNLFPVPAEKLGKLICLLSSANDGECLGAARALQRCLGESGADFHELADIVERNWRDPAPVVVVDLPEPEDWQAFAADLLRFPENLLERPNELDFLTNMRKSQFPPTAKQEKWMNDIAGRLTPEQRDR